VPKLLLNVALVYLGRGGKPSPQRVAGKLESAFDFTQIATNAGVPDVNKMKADQSAPFVEQQLGEAQNQAQQFGINSTPSFLIQVGNGKLEKLNYQNFQLSEFSGPIDAALQKAGA